jgi:hypothetical protein
MKEARNEVIEELVADMRSAPRQWAGDRQVFPWLVLSTIIVLGLMLLTDPLRPGAGEQLLNFPRFLLETILGVIAIIAVGTIAIRMAVPAGISTSLTGFAFVVVILWLSNYAIGLYFPTMELGMMGKREHCFWETLLYALPTIATGFWLIQRGYVVNWALAGFATGLVAGFIPAHLMQVACMYDAQHILLTHISPAFLIALPSALAGFAIQRWAQH